ncbi:MAG: hypothetical protein RLZZ314_853 [Bacteroidota bacterium]|jgi:hypothetical protein
MDHLAFRTRGTQHHASNGSFLVDAVYVWNELVA